MTREIPEGYTVLRTRDVTLVYRNGRTDLLRLAEPGPAPGAPSSRTGRSAIRIIEPDLVVRPLLHGGLFRALTGPRFLSASRSMRELATSAYLASQGIPTPEVLAVRVQRSGLFLSIEVVTRLVPGAVDLLTHLEDHPDDCRELMRRTGGLIRRMHDLGVYHPDLHVKNILLDARAELYVLDLDSARRFPRLPRFLRRMNLRRFARSVNKWHATGRIHVPESWELSFRAGYEDV